MPTRSPLDWFADTARRSTVALPGLTYAFPPAEKLAGAPLNGIGLTKARIQTIRNLSAAVADGRVSLDRGLDAEEMTAQLLSLKGVGPWTASYIAMRVPRDPDAFPAGDLGVKKAFAALGGSGDIEAWSARWKPWRSYAVMHLWGSLAQPTTGGAVGRGNREEEGSE